MKDFEKSFIKYVKQPSNANFNIFVKQIDFYLNLYCRHKIIRQEWDDVKQEIYKELWRTAKNYDPKKSRAIGYLKMVIKGSINDYLKTKYRAKNKIHLKTISIETSAYDGDDNKSDLNLKDIIAKEPKMDERLINNELLKLLFLKLAPMEKRVLKYAMLNQKLNCLSWSMGDISNNTGFTFKQIDNARDRIKAKADSVYKDYYKI